MKRLGLVAVVLVVLLSSFVSAKSYEPMDLPPDHWAYDAVRRLEDAGVVSLFPDGEYKGDALLSRYEFALYVDRTIRYMKQNVEHMNARQASYITGLLSDLFDEFREELAIVFLDVVNLEMEVERLKHRNSWRVNAETSASYEVVQRLESIGGVDVGSDTSELAMAFSFIGAGQRGGNHVSVSVGGSALMSGIGHFVDPAIEELVLSLENTSGLDVSFGTIRYGKLNRFLFAHSDEETIDMWGARLHVESDLAVFNKGIDVGFGYVRNINTASNDSVAVIVTGEHGGPGVDTSLSFALEKDPAVQDVHMVGGAELSWESERIGAHAEFAANADKEHIISVGGSIYLDENTELSLAYERVSGLFKGVSTILDASKTLTFGASHYWVPTTKLYTTITKDLELPLNEPPVYEFGVRTEGYALSKQSSLDWSLSYNSSEGIEADVKVLYDGMSEVGLYGKTADLSFGDISFGVEAKSILAGMELGVLYERGNAPDFKMDTFEIRSAIPLMEDVSLGLKWGWHSLQWDYGDSVVETTSGLNLTVRF